MFVRPLIQNAPPQFGYDTSTLKTRPIKKLEEEGWNFVQETFPENAPREIARLEEEDPTQEYAVSHFSSSGTGSWRHSYYTIQSRKKA